MKYYYNGKLVRTSKHEYKYGLLNTLGGIIACSKSKENLLKQKNREMKFNEKQIAYFKKHLGGKQEVTGLTNEELLEDYIKSLEKIKAWQIVELEAREN